MTSPTLSEWRLNTLNEVEDSNLDRYAWENLINRWIFDELDRKILKRKILDNASLERIAEEVMKKQRRKTSAFLLNVGNFPNNPVIHSGVQDLGRFHQFIHLEQDFHYWLAVYDFQKLAIAFNFDSFFDRLIFA